MKTRSTPASLLPKGQVTERITVKWAICFCFYYRFHPFVLLHNKALNDLSLGEQWILFPETLLYGVISNENDGDQLQEDLKQLEAWQNTWQMSFNPSKCKTICISTKRDPPQKKYVFCGVELEKVDSISYLGVILNDNLKWSKHVQSTTGKASKVLGMMKRSLWNCPKRVRETAYTAIVRPKLEYASSAWDPYHQKDIDSLERVQRKAARFLL